MDDALILEKTAQGVAELAGTTRALDRRLRPALILVNGQRSVGALCMLLQNIGLGKTDLIHLVRSGYVHAAFPPEPVPVAETPVTIADTIMPLADTVLGLAQTAPPVPSTRALPERDPLRRLAEGRQYLVETATRHMGLRAYLFVLNVERAASIEHLRQLLPSFEAGLQRRLGPTQAEQCRRVAESILLS